MTTFTAEDYRHERESWAPDWIPNPDVVNDALGLAEVVMTKGGIEKIVIAANLAAYEEFGRDALPDELEEFIRHAIAEPPIDWSPPS